MVTFCKKCDDEGYVEGSERGRDGCMVDFLYSCDCHEKLIEWVRRARKLLNDYAGLREDVYDWLDDTEALEE